MIKKRFRNDEWPITIELGLRLSHTLPFPPHDSLFRPAVFLQRDSRRSHSSINKQVVLIDCLLVYLGYA